MSICSYLFTSVRFSIQLSAYFSICFPSFFLPSRVYFPAAESLLSPRLILHRLSSSLTRCIRQQCASRVFRIYTSGLRIQVENYRSIFIHTAFNFYFILSLFFFFFGFTHGKHTFVSQTILLSSDWEWNRATAIAIRSIPIAKLRMPVTCNRA